MDQPTSSSTCDRPAKRQCRVSQDPKDENKLQSHLQQSSDAATIEAEVPVRTPGSLAAEFTKLLHYNDALATPALNLLDLYFCLWKCYVVKSAEKIQLEEEQRQLQESNEWLASNSDILLQLCGDQALILWDRKRAIGALYCDLDLDLHAIWQECSGIPTPPPCLATDSENSRQILSDEGETAGYETSGSLLIEGLFYPTYDKLSAFKWTGPDPLSISTQASDLFLYMSAFAFPRDVHWVEF
ncbi:hypothetical protein MYU51_020351 [Penicillium brevicompactum]